MSLQSFLEWFTQGSIVLLAILMVVQWTRWRDRVSLDIFLVFGSLAILLILERALRLTHIQAAWIRPLGISVLLAHPYLLSARRLALPAGLQNGAARGRRGLVVSLIVTWTAAWPFRSTALVPSHSCISSGCSVTSHGRSGKGARAGGVTHWRMRHAALGALLLATVFVLAVLIACLPCRREAAATALVPLAALGAAVNYYFAFAPPTWIRRMWQSSELYGFLSDRALAGGPFTQTTC